MCTQSEEEKLAMERKVQLAEQSAFQSSLLDHDRDDTRKKMDDSRSTRDDSRPTRDDSRMSREDSRISRNDSRTSRDDRGSEDGGHVDTGSRYTDKVVGNGTSEPSSSPRITIVS